MIKINRRNVPPLCECNCGEFVNWFNPRKKEWARFIHGHNCRINGLSNKGKRWAKEKPQPLNYCQCGCGGLCFNKFVHGHNSKGVIFSEATCNKISKSNTGRTVSLKNKIKHSKLMKKLWQDLEYRNKQLKDRKNRKSGYHNIMPEGYSETCSKRQIKLWEDLEYKEAHSGENHHNWQGGLSFLPYSKDWTKELKNQIRLRDGYQCRICNVKQKDLKVVLDVHHIDYDKENCNSDNLISLCRSCHGKTNHNRSEWKNYFKKEIKLYKGETI